MTRKGKKKILALKNSCKVSKCRHNDVNHGENV